MDMSFANQALSARWLWVDRPQLEPRVYKVPDAIDREIARRKLEAMGIEIEQLTPAQQEYLASYDHGT